MSKEDKAGRGSKVDGSIDARGTSRNDQAAWQKNRPMEDRVTAHEISDDDILNWKKRFREVSGFGQVAVGTISMLEGSFQIKLGGRYRSHSTNKPDINMASDLESISRFAANTRPELLADPRLGQDVRDAYQQFLVRLLGLQSVFTLVAKPPTEASWVMDEATKYFFQQSYQKLPELVRKRLKTGSFWKLHEKLLDKTTALERGRNKISNLPKEITAVSSSIISHAFYLTRFFLILTEDQATQEVISDAFKLTSDAAKYIEDERQKFANLDLQLNPLAGISNDQLPEAQEIWNELIT